MYKFKIQINHIDLFQSSLNNVKHSRTFYFDSIFTFAAIIITIFSVFTHRFFEFENYKKVLLIFCCFLFPLIQPLILYFKSINHANKIKNLIINIEFNDDNILISSSDEKISIKYENVYNFIKYNNMIIIMYDSIHGQIIPNRVFQNNRDEFYDYVCKKIKDARDNKNKNY